MLNGVMLLWFILTLLSVLFVVIDIRSTPESKVLKWGFILLTVSVQNKTLVNGYLHVFKQNDMTNFERIIGSIPSYMFSTTQYHEKLKY